MANYTAASGDVAFTGEPRKKGVHAKVAKYEGLSRKVAMSQSKSGFTPSRKGAVYTSKFFDIKF